MVHTMSFKDVTPDRCALCGTKSSVFEQEITPTIYSITCQNCLMSVHGYDRGGAIKRWNRLYRDLELRESKAFDAGHEEATRQIAKWFANMPILLRHYVGEKAKGGK